MSTDQSARVLVAYGSRLGSTAQIATFIGEVLSEEGATVDVKQVEEVGGLDSYDRIIVGGAIRYDRWLPEVVDFVRSNQAVLREVPVALFFTCLAMSEAKGAAKSEQYAQKVSALLPGLDAARVGRFAGVHDPSKAPWMIRILLKIISLVTGVKEGDYRDWESIRHWVRSL